MPDSKMLSKSAWAIFEYLQNPLLILITTPIFLEILGTKTFGLWILFTSTTSIGSYFAAGLVQAVTKQTASTQRQEVALELRKLSSGASFVALTNINIIALLLAGYFFLASHEETFSSFTWWSFFSCVIFSIFFDQFDAICTGFLRGFENFGTNARIESIVRVLQYLFSCAFLYAGAGIETIFFTATAFSALRLLARFLAAGRQVPNLALIPSLPEARRIASLAFWGLVQGLGYLLYNVFDRFVIADALDYQTLSTYSISAQVSTQVHAIASAGISVLFPLVSRLHVHGNTKSIIQHSRILSRVTFAFSGTALLIIYLQGENLLRLWLNAEIALKAAPTLTALSFIAFIQSLSIVPMFILLGLGKAREIALISLIGGIFSSLAMLALAHPMGILGILCGKLFYCVILLYTNFLCYLAIRKIDKCSSRS